MAKEYDPNEIEKKWQKEWNKSEIYKTRESSDKPKFYILDMFPYVSGEGIHVGHPKGYIATDIVSRMKRMQGFSVLHPMGFDAFGLPAENYAIKTKTNPVDAVRKNIKRYKKQLEMIGFDYDWSREISTSDPNFYKWTQWIFLKLFENGLAYESNEPVNWCPVDKTILANEDVENGKCERCGSVVEKRPIRQWVLKITDYADRLLDDLEELDWPRSIKESQKNWIGRSKGAEIDFNIKDSDEKIKVFTTRPDTIFGATYMVLAPEHPLVDRLKSEIKNWDEVRKYIEDTAQKKEIERTDLTKEKIGVKLKGVLAINPLNNKELPVFMADYVLPQYATGAIMAVPAHDDRDFHFAVKYNLEIIEVVKRPKGELNYLFINLHDGDKSVVAETIREYSERSEPVAPTIRMYHLLKGKAGDVNDLLKNHKVGNPSIYKSILEGQNLTLQQIGKTHKIILADIFPGDGKHVNSEFLDGLGNAEAIDRINNYLEKSDLGKRLVTYRLRDWVFSRQRYWGEPIPILRDGDKIIPLTEKDLPLKLPEVESYEPTGTEESPLANIPEWINVKVGNKVLRRESNTMPQWAGSSWYYLRFMDPNNDEALVGKKKEKYWNTVDLYVGGAEHATRHLIYARFWHKFLYDIGVVSTKEPFKRLQHVGLIIAEDGRKMSKRWGNIINPDEIISTFGADTLRMYEMFMGPFDQSVAWNTQSMVGVRRFLERVWKLKTNIVAPGEIHPKYEMHKAIKKVSEDIETMSFNTAVSTLMIYANALEKHGEIVQEEYETLLKLLAPFAPHITEELWQMLGHAESVHKEKWPQYDSSKLETDEVTLAIQVNGKVRGTLTTLRIDSEEEIKKKALLMPEVQKWLKGGEPSKVIVVPGRLISIVT